MSLTNLRADLEATKQAAVSFVADLLGATWLPPGGLPNLQREIEAAYQAWLERCETQDAPDGSVRTLHDLFVERYQIESAFLALGADLPD
jgi:hypothetical protein